MGAPAPRTHRMVKAFWKGDNATKAEAKKAPRYYPAEDVKGKLGNNHHNTRKQTKLRASITPAQWSSSLLATSRESVLCSSSSSTRDLCSSLAHTRSMVCLCAVCPSRM